MGFNITRIKTASDGVWQGDNPLNYAFPLLTVQTIIVLVTCRFLVLIFKPLRQPKVVAEIIGGILLGPSALGRNAAFQRLVFPPWSRPILESVASIGLLFFLFLVGLELDLTSLRHSGRKAFSIALAGMLLPFAFGTGISFFIKKTIVDPHDPQHHIGYGEFVMFMGVALSITAFPVLARILAELKLLTTHLGQTAMVAAAFNDVAAWILLALAVALAGNSNGEHKSPLIPIWVLLSGLAFVIVMMVLIRPAMKYAAGRFSPEHDAVNEGLICLTLCGVLVSGLITDLIGIHSIFGAFVFGLTIPKTGVFGERLTEKIEDFVSGLLLPLYFASSGLKTDVAKIHEAGAWGILVLVIVTACAGKILGTFVTAMTCAIPVRESLALGVLMNTKGLVELIVLNIGREKGVLTDEMFAILVLMAVFTTFITTPFVMAIYKPSHGRNYSSSPRLSKGKNRKDDELRVLACVHGPGNAPSLIKLIQTLHTPPNTTSFKLYLMHLIELTDRPSSISMVNKVTRLGLPFVNRFYESNDRIVSAFEQSGISRVRHIKGISGLTTMHEDICHVAEDKRVEMIILPYNKAGDEWGVVNRKVMENAHCTVSVFVDRGFGTRGAGSSGGIFKRIGIVFFGGADDREALEVGMTMAHNNNNSTTKLTLLRFVDGNYADANANNNLLFEKEMDENAIEEFKKRCNGLVEHEERVIKNNLRQVLMEIGMSEEYELVIIGKGRWSESTPVGPVGDIILESSDGGFMSSVLVVQQHKQNDKDPEASNTV